jgi:lipopolysaccharide transport system permease protein
MANDRFDRSSGAGAIATDRPLTVIRPPSVSRPRLLQQLRRLPQYGDLLRTLTAHRIRVRYKQSILGASWAVVQPLSMMLIFTFVFTFIFPGRAPSEGVPYGLFVYTGLVAWTFFSSGLTTAANGLVGHAHLVTKVFFPREILPLTYVAAALTDFLIASVVLAALMAYYEIALTWQSLWVVPIVVVITALITALGLLLSAVQVRYRDIGMAMPLLLQLWLFASPVIYPLGIVPERLYPVYTLNPMVGTIENFRRVLVIGTPPDLHALGISAAVAAILLPVAYLYFKHAEATMADII